MLAGRNSELIAERLAPLRFHVQGNPVIKVDNHMFEQGRPANIAIPDLLDDSILLTVFPICTLDFVSKVWLRELSCLFD
jgi:hypothetical protein